ncbi:MAG: amidohydrolase [Planctomycetota bacterium]|nr:MAG: amidohydrolase [Planctomycetota bacterium]
MRVLPSWLILLVVCGCAAPRGSAQGGGPGGDLEAFYRELHASPELSFHEEKTSARMAAVLREAGFEVTERVGGFGVVGVLRNGDGPTLLVRTDMDALPVTEETGLPFASRVRTKDDAGNEVGVMHACGHDIHMTVWTGTARWLAAHKDQWRGTLVLIAQPAEERGAGARQMLEDGLFTRFPKPDFCIALHADGQLPAGMVGYTPGYCYANVDTVDVTVRGKGGHGSAPHTTKDPVLLAARIVLALQTLVSREVDPLDSAVVTVGSIHGGTKHNIIPEEVKLQITVRSYTPEVRKLLLEGIHRTAVGEAQAAGFPQELWPEVVAHMQEHTPASYNDPALVERVNRALAAALGADQLKEMPASMGGEDFGRFAPAAGCPGYMFRLGSIRQEKYDAAQKPGAPPLPSLHTKDYAPLAGPTIETGVKAMTAAVLELMAQPH